MCITIYNNGETPLNQRIFDFHAAINSIKNKSNEYKSSKNGSR